MQKREKISVRQLCFFLAFLLPVSKILETPALLAYYAKDDLLLPAFLQFLLQAIMLLGVIYFSSKTDETVFSFLSKKLGKGVAKTLYLLLALYYLFFSILPLLGIERFVYTAFFDTAPNLSAFAPFFLLAAYAATKPLTAFGRICELSAPVFLVAFLGLMLLSVGKTDFTALMPLFSSSPRSVGLGVLRSFPHFSDTAFLLPFLGHYRYRKGDGKKIIFSFGAGAIAVLFFLAVFYGVFGELAPLQPFALSKIAGYFSGLDVIGRIDLLLVYLTTVLLLFYYCLPLSLAVHCFCQATNTQNKLPASAIISLSLLLLTVFFNRLYGALYAFISTAAVWVFPFFAYGVPIFILLVYILKKERGNSLA